MKRCHVGYEDNYNGFTNNHDCFIMFILTLIILIAIICKII